MAYEELTFNELPSAITLLLQKVEGIEKQLHQLQGSFDRKKQAEENGHIPMTLKEACEFLKMKQSTMYYHLENGNLPATRKGKNYILFKDELLKWAESGRTNDIPLTISEREEVMSTGVKRHLRMGY
jgi:excisionase family DNA binding protein